jgi:thymidylate kinase
MRQKTATLQLETLRSDVESLGKVLYRQARRPFVLEITGTPKAGKTTLITLVDGFLRQSGWKVHVLEERAGACQLPMKGHFFFNTWTTGTMLAGLLDAIDRDYDVVILDRGLFDALVWLELQVKQGQISRQEAKTFEDFVLLARWRTLTDATIVIDVPPSLAMARETERRLIPRRGSVMNQTRLREFNQALGRALRKHRTEFKIIRLGNGGDAKAGAAQVLRQLVERARVRVDPKIAVLPVAVAKRYLDEGATLWSGSLWRSIATSVTYRRRSEVEDDDNWLQLLACGAQVHSERIFLSIRRRERGRALSSRDDTGRIWQGCHVTKPPKRLTVDVLAHQLQTRLREDLHVSELGTVSQPLGFVWTPEGKETRHLGVMFKVSLEEHVANFLEEKEFKTNGRGHTLKSSFVRRSALSPDKIAAGRYALEDWSRELLKKKWVP